MQEQIHDLLALIDRNQQWLQQGTATLRAKFAVLSQELTQLEELLRLLRVEPTTTALRGLSVQL